MVKTRGTGFPFAVFFSLAAATGAQTPARVDTADPFLARALAVLARHPVLDGHNDLPWAIRESAAGDLAA